MQSSMRGRGKESGLVKALTLRKSVQNLGVLSDFGTNRHGEAQLELDVSAIPLANM